jgi:hypothetical protein
VRVSPSARPVARTWHRPNHQAANLVGDRVEARTATRRQPACALTLALGRGGYGRSVHPPQSTHHTTRQRRARHPTQPGSRGAAGSPSGSPSHSTGVATPSTLDVPDTPCVAGDRGLRRACGRRWGGSGAHGFLSRPRHTKPAPTGCPTAAAGTHQPRSSDRRGGHTKLRHPPHTRRRHANSRSTCTEPGDRRHHDSSRRGARSCAPSPGGDQPTLTRKPPCAGARPGDTGPST